MTKTIFEWQRISEDEVEISTSHNVSQEESELFARITSDLAKGGVPYGQAVILVARYACMIEDRVIDTGSIY